MAHTLPVGFQPSSNATGSASLSSKILNATEPSLGTGGYLLNVAVPVTSVVGYGGGLLCAVDTGQGCSFSNVFLGNVASNALTESLTISAIPEPSTFALLLAGLTAICWRRSRGLGES